MLWVHMARLFVCDDDAAYRALLRVVLTDSGEHEVVGEADDGRECIELAAEAKPDVILLDLHMPGMGGFEALPRLRERAPDAKVVALTTTRAEDRELDFLDLGGVAFIEKPHEIFALPAALRRVLDAATDAKLDLVAELLKRWWSGERESALALCAADVEYKPLRSERTYQGVEALAAYVDEAQERTPGASVAAEQLLLVGDEVVVLATAAVPRKMADGTAYTEHFPVAWVMHVGGGAIDSIHTFASWEEAKAEAGIRRGHGPDLERRLARSAWRWALAGLPRRFIAALGAVQPLRLNSRSTSA
jgi:CheY-like chemotaxis protein